MEAKLIDKYSHTKSEKKWDYIFVLARRMNCQRGIVQTIDFTHLNKT